MILIKELKKLEKQMNRVAKYMVLIPGEIYLHGRELDGAREQVLSWIKGLKSSENTLTKTP